MKTGQITSAGQASRRRQPDTATAEFAAGIAGARIDRISADAQVNKAQICKYYRSKDELFDAVFAEHVERIVETVPETGDALPGYAVRLYDSYLVHPELVRLATWARLERTPTGPVPLHAGARRGEAAIDHRRPGEGACRPGAPGGRGAVPRHGHVDGLVPASVMVTASKDEAEVEHDRRRTALASAVRRAFAA